MNEAHGCYVQVKPGCGCRLGVIVDDPKIANDVARWIARSVRDGFRIERLATCDEFRSGPFGCRNDSDCEFAYKPAAAEVRK